MLHPRALSLVLGLLCVTAGAAERRYLEFSNPQLSVISAVSEEETRQIALRIEMFRAAVEQALGVSISRAIQTRIFALSDRDWKQYARPRPGVSGYFLSHPASGDLMFNANDATAAAYELVFHEYVHHILRTSWAGEVPAFLDEGLAEVFSTARFHKGAVRVTPRFDYVRFLRNHDWLPFDRLLKVRRHDPEYVEHNLAPAFYAQAWATMYYALAIDPASGGRAMAYLREIQSNPSAEKAAERLIEATTLDANREIAEFIRRRQRLPIAQIVPGGAPAGGKVTLRRLSHDDSTLAIGELMLRFGNRHEKAQGLFDQVRQRDPKSVRATVGAAWAHLQAHELPEAASLLDRPLPQEVDPATAVALARGLYQLASAVSKPDAITEEQRSRLLRARALFDSALSNKSMRIEALSGYVLSNLALGESGESLIVMADVGYRLAPRSSDLAIALAILHDLAGRKDVAATYWQAAARNSQTGPLRARLRDALQAAEED